MRFHVKVLQPDLALGTLTIDAADAEQARRSAQAQGHGVVAVSRARWQRSPGGARAQAFPLLLFSQELLALLDSGLGIVEAVETLAEKEAAAATRGVLAELLTGLRQGLALSAVMQTLPQAFPPLYVASVRASERTSSLGEALARYVAYAQQVQTLRARLVGAATYPVILIGVGTLVILFLLGYVVPRFAHIYEDMGEGLPLLSRLLLQWGQAVDQHWPLLATVALGAVVLLAGGGGRWLGQRLLGRLWRVPAVGERMRIFQLARLYRTLGMLLRGGIPAVPALEMAAGLLSPALRPRLAEATRCIREGQALSVAFDAQGLTTPVSARMLRVGERGGRLGEMMERAAAFHDDEIARWAEWATRLMGPLLMLAMGIVIGTVVVLMYLPIFQLAEAIQ
jgi:general secretion pathway protein F